MRHEIGHAIVLEHKLNDPEWNSKFNSILDVFDKATDPKNKEYVLPSTYADDYVDEFIAECIAASYMKRSKQSETVKKVIEILVGKGVN